FITALVVTRLPVATSIFAADMAANRLKPEVVLAKSRRVLLDVDGVPPIGCAVFFFFDLVGRPPFNLAAILFLLSASLVMLARAPDSCPVYLSWVKLASPPASMSWVPLSERRHEERIFMKVI